MKLKVSTVVATVGLLVVTQTGSTHHSFAAVFDRDSPIELTGTVTQLEWMNPHTWFYMDVERDEGSVENWALEMGSPNTLIRRGWNRNSLNVGDVVTVIGFQAREKAQTGAVRSITLASGERLFGAQDESR